MIAGAVGGPGDVHLAAAHRRGHSASEEIRYALRLSLVSCTLVGPAVAVGGGSGGLRVVAVSRFPRAGALVDAVLDIPIVLPPLVMGLALLILFNRTWWAGRWSGSCR